MSTTATITSAEFQAKARSGDPDAQFALARLFDAEGRHDVAVGWLQIAADAGHAPSMSYLGARLTVGRAAPLDPVKGSVLIEGAAAAGGADAAHMAAVLRANGVGLEQNWGEALRWLRIASKRGDPRAAPQLAIIGDDPGTWLEPLPVQDVSTSPRIGVVRAFAPKSACDWLISRAQGRLKQTGVYKPGPTANPQPNMRTNSGAGFALFDGDVVLALLRTRIAAALGLARDLQEAPNVLHYSVGQSFDHHFDFLNPDVPGFAQVLAREGQRIATFLLYLNDSYEGGETEFPEMHYRFKGQTGDALFFFSVDGEDRVDPRTVHAGLPPTSGEKWVLSQWVRSKPQPVV